MLHMMELDEGIWTTNREEFKGWNLNKANWTEFVEKCDLNYDSLGDIEENYETMVEQILTAANEAIPQKKGSPKYSCPWWNDTCKEAIRVRKCALNRFRRSHSTAHLMQYKEAKAKARRTIRQAKKESWEKLLHLFNVNTPLHQLWGIIRKFTRKERYQRPLPVLNVAGNMIDSPFEVANILGQFFSDISSSLHYRPSFRQQERDMSEQIPSFVSLNDEVYNDTFTLHELQESITNCGNTSMGPDNLHYAFFKHLNETQIQKVLMIINTIWCAGIIPKQWKHSIVVPILKPGKPRENTDSYRPIQLTSWLLLK